MFSYTTILFDLDGTLVDSSIGITKSVSYALEKRGYGIYKPETLKAFIGPPLREQFMTFCNADIDEGAALVTAYRKYYTTKGIFECSVYDGIPELLSALQQKGFSLLVATSKPEKFAKMILEHFEIAGYFDFIGGANLDNTRTAKDQVISYVLEHVNGGIDIQKCLMVGDSKHDVFGAAKIGMNAVAVSYGFGEIKELQESNPVCICDSPKALLKFLCD